MERNPLLKVRCGSLGRMLKLSGFLCQEMLIITVGLGNCGKEAGNGSLEKDSLSYSQQGMALRLSLKLTSPLPLSS